jgi:hypothetical protein
VASSFHFSHLFNLRALLAELKKRGWLRVFLIVASVQGGSSDLPELSDGLHQCRES